MCSKCNSTNILRIPGSTGVGVSNAIQTGLTIIDPALVTRYLCCDCGYSEEWIDDTHQIQRLIKKYKR